MTPRRPALWNSRLRPWAREARPSCGCDPSLAGGITRGYCGGARMTLRGSLYSPSRTQPRAGAGAPSSSTVSWQSGRYGRPCPWWPMTCPESPRFVFSFLARRCPFMLLLQSMTPVLLPQELETRSLEKSVFLQRERGIWDQLQRQKGLLADANELLSARSAEVEDLRLRCADAKVEAATAQT